MQKMNQVVIEKDFIPHIAIWAGKRADGADREPDVPFVVGDFVVAKSFGLHFVPDEHFALRHDGLILTGVSADSDEIDIHRSMLKFHICIVVQNINDKLLINGPYDLIGWTTRRELQMNFLPSRKFGMDGARMTFEMLRDMGELEAAIEAGEILIDVEEKEKWWDRI
jgi:hypothetical protein